MRLIAIFCAFATAQLAGAVIAAPAISAGESVVKIKAVESDGGVAYGSGVVIGKDTVATVCHLTRRARTIEVSRGSDGAPRWRADAQIGSIYHDLCLLTVRNLDAPAVAIRPSADLRLHERVMAAGFPGGGELAVNEGTVEGLYRYDEGQVIRTSASFDFGASGGALFDHAGRLVGFLAFKARTGEGLRFALPVDWVLPDTVVGSSLLPIDGTAEQAAFWEGPKTDQPPFLRTALMDATSQR